MPFAGVARLIFSFQARKLMIPLRAGFVIVSEVWSPIDAIEVVSELNPCA